jgi:hypothetical protein
MADKIDIPLTDEEMARARRAFELREAYDREYKAFAATNATADGWNTVTAANKLTPGQQDIVDCITAIGRRLITEAVLDALERSGKPASSGTTKNYLAELVRRGMLNNRTDSRGTGYGLPSWS